MLMVGLIIKNDIVIISIVTCIGFKHKYTQIIREPISLPAAKTGLVMI